jgi:Na+/proline symporter/nitrogen-specific signal transduction histidine kinase
MFAPGIALTVAIVYLSVLFAVAYYGDKRGRAGRSLIANPYTYALSIAVYCTAWTFYGSVGRAASSGLDFLAIYVGPTLAALLWWHVLRRIVRISKVNRITSIADFIASRYGKSQLLGGLATVIAVVGIVPYIALQLKAVSNSYQVLQSAPGASLMMASAVHPPVLEDTAFHVAIIMALFAVLFGTRHIDVTERHEGMVAAIAFESIVKLFAFLAVGVFVVFGLFDGPADLFARAAERPEIARLFTGLGATGYGGWVTLTLLSMAAILFLPRQFQVAVVENVNERHLGTAIWMFPAYLLLINLFVLPIAVAGALIFAPGTVDADTFVLALPLREGLGELALLAFIGGLSAATAMVIVESIALATMVCNDLVMPVLLRLRWLGFAERRDLGRTLVRIRRASIVVVLMLGYFYFRVIGETYALVTIGLISFVAVAQFAPAMIGGLFWRGATRTGALVGLSAGFAVWLYTLFVPAFARSGWVPESFIAEGAFGVALLKPYALFGLGDLDNLTHALFWSMVFNIGGYVAASIVTRQSHIERVQATRFIDVFRQTEGPGGAAAWPAKTVLADLEELVARFVGRARAAAEFARFERERAEPGGRAGPADRDAVRFAERLLAGAIGAASARVAVASVVKQEGLGLEEVLQILDESSQVIEYSRQLEQKSMELERATAELRGANERLKELDRLKDEFIATVTHELRTPLTSIRSFSEILHDNPDLPAAQRREFQDIIIKESERLTRLINQVLDLARLEAGRFDWRIGPVDLGEVVAEAIAATRQLFNDKAVSLEVAAAGDLPPALVDRDRLMQVVINLLSNAVKFSPRGSGRVVIAAGRDGGMVKISITDNGVGIAPADRERVFERVLQVGDPLTDKPEGSGLGLAISRRIVEHLGGRIWVESAPGKGSTFAFVLPIAEPAVASAAK